MAWHPHKHSTRSPPAAASETAVIPAAADTTVARTVENSASIHVDADAAVAQIEEEAASIPAAADAPVAHGEAAEQNLLPTAVPDNGLVETQTTSVEPRLEPMQQQQQQRQQRQQLRQKQPIM